MQTDTDTDTDTLKSQKNQEKNRSQLIFVDFLLTSIMACTHSQYLGISFKATTFKLAGLAIDDDVHKADTMNGVNSNNVGPTYNELMLI